ncbi:aldose 1-epimerase [Sphingomonas gellani]|uniref:Aldose 1-epimerase n=1 Tax=Sphingomonas gellani TaxID=1166340 RepID=A0A1H8FYC7_9SPHN|nr:aldose 1-epimerase [Sphingomonas gellani]SEN36841.1 aldose 1-epimerase [Sphingomonas gellani]
MDEVVLTAGKYRLTVAPARGGSVDAFQWAGQALLRATCGPSILDTACFPLVPFSNRIAQGRFYAGTEAIRLAPNFPGEDHPHTLHGFGWLAAWEVRERSEHHTLLRHRHEAGEWPWRYVAEQRFDLSVDGLRQGLSVTNLSDTAMPAGLGFHPYFPRNDQTLYHALHLGEWRTADDGLPERLERFDAPTDGWDGRPVASRNVDTVFAGRSGALVIAWPDRDLTLTISPSDALSSTVVYVPAGRDFFCVEPVSHFTDAINMRGGEGEMRWLSPGETMSVTVDYRAS